MIKNDLQHRVAKSALKKFQATLEIHDESMKDQKAWVKQAHRATIIGEIQKLENSIDEYERLKKGEIPTPTLDVIADIPEMLIKRRISLGWTQEDLAKKLGVRAQQVQNDEATNYETASLARLMKTAEILQHGKIKRKKTTASKRNRNNQLGKST